MLLHKLYINVAIANILLYQKSRYDLPEGKYKILKNFNGRGRKGRGSSKCHSGEKVYPSQFALLGPNRTNYVEKSSGPKRLSRIYLSCLINKHIRSKSQHHQYHDGKSNPEKLSNSDDNLYLT